MDASTELLKELQALRDEVRALRSKVSTPLASAVTVEAAAARLGCGRTTVFAYLAEGKLTRARKHGRETMVTLASLEALEAPEQGSASPARQERTVALPAAFDAEGTRAALKALARQVADSRTATGTEQGRKSSAKRERQRTHRAPEATGISEGQSKSGG